MQEKNVTAERKKKMIKFQKIKKADICKCQQAHRKLWK